MYLDSLHMSINISNDLCLIMHRKLEITIVSWNTSCNDIKERKNVPK